MRTKVPTAKDCVFEPDEEQKKPASEDPRHSILGLGGIDRSALRLPLPAPSANGEPPTRSLLGLEGLSTRPLKRSLAGKPSEVPPNPSILGLGAAHPAPLAPMRPIPGAPDAPPPNPSILGLGATRPSPNSTLWRRPVRRPTAARRPVEPTSPVFFGLGGAPVRGARAAGEPASRSFFGLEALPYAGSVAAAVRAEAPEEPAEVEVPEFERDVEHKAEPGFPIERAILLSIAAHVAIILLLIFAPAGTRDPRRGLLSALVPPENPYEKIPLVFREAPGAARPNPKKSDLSDADRRASGGDRSKPKAESPFVPDRPGMQGLQPGSPIVRAPFEAARPAPQKPAPQPDTQTARANPENELDGLRVPSAGQTRPGATTEFNDLRSVAQQAARDVLAQNSGGGQGGAGFPNPDGGFVDTGPISFETSWYDWGDYLQAMLSRIKAHWDPSRDPFRWKTTIRFAIHPDGSITDIAVVRPSKNPAFIYGCRKAIEGSNPLPPLPKDLLASVGLNHVEHVAITFLYNYRTGDWEAEESAK